MKNMKNKTPVIAINFFFEACFHPAFSRSPREYVTLNWFFGTLYFSFQICVLGFNVDFSWVFVAKESDISYSHHSLYKININFCKYVLYFATICEETSGVIAFTPHFNSHVDDEWKEL